ncbi:MAG: hypothetical protein V3U54_08540 [Thermodesulfobacteriota bacterium]
MSENPTNIERFIKWVTPKKKEPSDKPGLIELIRTISPKETKGFAVLIAGIVAVTMLIMTGGSHGAGWFLVFLWAIF